jgi:lysophospholipase L1-like esterase
VAPTQITVTGSYTTAGGDPAEGSVSFQLRRAIIDSSANVVVARTTHTVELDAAGAFSVSLAATDDAESLPVGNTYQVVERINGARTQRWSFELPHDAPDATVDMADLVPVDGGDLLVYNGGAAATARTASGVKAHRRFVGIGDSITRGNGGSDGQNNASSWFDAGMHFLGRRGHKVNNAGVPADFTSYQLARFDTDVLAYAPDVVLIAGGINDIELAFALGGVYVYDTWTKPYHAAMIEATLDAGATPVLVFTNSRDSRPGSCAALRAGERALAAEYHIPFLDLYEVLVDPTDGGITAAYSPDALHPNSAGGMLLGRAMADALPSMLNLDNNALPVPGYTGELGWILADLFVSGSSSGIPTGWSAYQANGVSATRSVVAPSDGDDIIGNWFRLTRSADNGDFGIQRTVALTAGSIVEVVARVRTAAGVTGDWPQVMLTTSGGNLQVINGTFSGQHVDGWFIERFTVPVGVTSGTLRLYVDGSASTGTMDFAQVGVRNATFDTY